MSIDYAFWKAAKGRRISRGLLYLLVCAGAEIDELEPIDQRSIQMAIDAAFPGNADPDSPYSFIVHFEANGFTLNTYGSTPTTVLEWFGSYAAQNGMDMFDPQAQRVTKRDQAACSKRLREAEKADEALVQRLLLPEIERRAASGEPRAMVELAHAYFFGEAAPTDRQRAFHLYCGAAEAGDAEGIFNLASCYERGDGTTRDTAKAIEWYLRAATTDKLLATFALGQLYAADGPHHDRARAVEWFRIALEHGHQDAPRALRNLGALPPLPKT